MSLNQGHREASPKGEVARGQGRIRLTVFSLLHVAARGFHGSNAGLLTVGE